MIKRNRVKNHFDMVAMSLYAETHGFSMKTYHAFFLYDCRNTIHILHLITPTQTYEKSQLSNPAAYP